MICSFHAGEKRVRQAGRNGERRAPDLIAQSAKALQALLTRRVTIECDRIPYEFQHVTLKKIVNWIAAEASALWKTESAWGWPTHMQVEPTNLCNLRCVFCHVTGGMERPREHLDFSVFKQVIDEVGDYLFLILLWDWGEPFLNPSLCEMIAYAKKRDIKIVSSTNGHLLADETMARRVVSSGLDSLIFAVDGITQATYEKYRRGGNLETVLAGIRSVVKAKEDLASETPLVIFRFLAMKHNEHEIPKLRDFAGSLGVDAVAIKTLNVHTCGTQLGEEGNEGAFLPEAVRYRRFHSAESSRIRHRRNPCKNPWNCPAIHCGGKVCLCTFDVHGRHTFGDLRRQSVRAIWRGNSYRQFRRQFRDDYQGIPLCADCTFAFAGGSLGTETIVDVHFFKRPCGSS